MTYYIFVSYMYSVSSNINTTSWVLSHEKLISKTELIQMMQNHLDDSNIPYTNLLIISFSYLSKEQYEALMN